jgi:hypothetical protein
MKTLYSNGINRVKAQCGAPVLGPTVLKSMDGSVVTSRTSFRAIPVPIRF